MRMHRIVGCVVMVGAVLAGLGLSLAASPAPPQAPAPNTLTAAERAAGWTLLFDGKTTNGWRGFKRDHFPVDGWAVVDGTLARVASQTPLTEGCDIITDG
jgi:hypothetical protein